MDSGRKAAIVAQRYSGAESVCAVARRHGLRHTQLFTWGREMRRVAAAAPTPLFVPAVIDPASSAVRAAETLRRSCSGRARRRSPVAVELEIGGVVARVAPGADAATIAAIIAALKDGG